jgi:putative acetyltransferase
MRNVAKPVIHRENESDAASVFEVHRTAFETDAEARLVDALRAAGDIVLSLVAEMDGKVVGSVVYSRLAIDDENHGATALAPISIIPSQQKQGISNVLIGVAHETLATANERLVIVLGDPAYYRRFGFSHEAASKLRTPYDGPYLMALNLAHDGAAVSGTVTYPPAFAALS